MQKRKMTQGCLICLLGLAIFGCDQPPAQDAVEVSEEVKAFLDTPVKKTGAHRPNDPHSKLDAEQLAEVAMQHLDESRTQLALDTLGTAINSYARNPMLLNMRASILLQKGKFSLALADLNRALELSPHDPALLTNRAQALRSFKRSEEAMRDLDSALELQPDFVAALFNRGSMQFEAGRFELALADFERCIEIEPGLPALWFNRASAHDALGRRDLAIEDLQHFLSLSPKSDWQRIANELIEQWQTEAS